MPHPGALGLFLVAALALAVTPGPAVLYIVTRSVSQGRAAGVASCLGIALGGTVHVGAAALGLSALLHSSALAFGLVKYAGAGYLLWLGAARLLSDRAPTLVVAGGPRSLHRVFFEGALVNILNPKTALFFLAFLPQFVSPSAGPVTAQVLFLGGVFLLLALSTDTVWSLLASTAASWLVRHPAFPSSERYVTGSIYVGLGVAAAVSGSGRK